ncbi:MAG: hypothetical protein JSV52_14450 [Candidatus Zixiibacteriota bacterium]|nr:MAG: hypothetical protein JSV52_14450 [candidate division Zixibacteria bacterium]
MKLKRKRPSVAIDTVPMPERTAKRGKVLYQRGKYYVIVGRRRSEIPIGTFASRAEIARLVGKDVVVVFSRRRKTEIVAIGTWPTPERRLIRWPIIVCYIPAPDLMRRLGDEMRLALIRNMVREKIISPQFARKIRGAIRG